MSTARQINYRIYFRSTSEASRQSNDTTCRLSHFLARSNFHVHKKAGCLKVSDVAKPRMSACRRIFLRTHFVVT
jgi:hypothetical protein